MPYSSMDIKDSGITVVFINGSMVVCRTWGSISITTSPHLHRYRTPIANTPV